MRRLLKTLFIFGGVAGVILWALSAPTYVSKTDFLNLVGDKHAGEQVFYQSGCASCHAAPNATAPDKVVLSGGMRFPSDFGVFIAPNISPDPEYGIGEWGLFDFANALQKGVSPDGAHYYPAFPYTSYARMTLQDIADLYVYLKTLPVSKVPNQPHVFGFPL